MNRKILSIVIVCTLMLGLFAPIITIQGEASESIDTSRYGDVLDIGTKLRHLEKDEAYRANLDKQIKEIGSSFNVNEQSAEGSGSSSFTFDGGTKVFLGYDTVEGNYLKTYTLRSIGENVEIWVANDLSFQDDRPTYVITQEQVDNMKDVFDQTIYATDTDFFGAPDSHTGEEAEFTQWFGYDEDGNKVDDFDFYDYNPQNYIPEGFESKERVILLVDNIRDEQYYDPEYPFFIAGFFSPTVESYIDRNIINLDAKDWETRLESTFFGTAAHEFQHLIHDDNDSSEENWINEGMSDFAEYLCFNEHPWGHVNFFLDHPENSLIEWDEHYSSETGPETLADYGQAYLMQLYLLDQFGKDFVRALATNKLQGIESVNEVLSDFNTEIDFSELFRRFTIAVAIDSESPGDGIYNFDSIDINVNYESALEYDKDGVPAWGGDYKILDEPNKIHDIKLDGISFLPTPWKVVDDPKGVSQKVLWGNNGNLADNQLIFEADLTGTDTATITFDTLIDIEPGWDAGMIQISTDNGRTWTSLANEDTISQNEFDYNDQAPEIYNNLPGFSMNNEEWVNEAFDLTPYAGQQILINFRYMTDGAYNDSGWFIDNINIPEIDYNNDCSSLDSFMSIDEMNEVYVEYAVTFINEKTRGKSKKGEFYRVLNINPFNVTEADAVLLKDFFSGGNTYMVIWYAAPDGTKGTVDYTYEITTKSEYNKNKDKGNKKKKDSN